MLKLEPNQDLDKLPGTLKKCSQDIKIENAIQKWISEFPYDSLPAGGDLHELWRSAEISNDSEILTYRALRVRITLHDWMPLCIPTNKEDREMVLESATNYLINKQNK